MVEKSGESKPMGQNYDIHQRNVLTSNSAALGIPQAENAKYLKLFGFQVGKMYYWLFGRVNHNCRLKASCHEAILEPIWPYGVHRAARDSNIETLQRFQNKYLTIIVNAPLCVINDALHHDLNVPFVGDEIRRLSQRYVGRMEQHPNVAINLTRNAKTPRGSKRRLSQDPCT